VVGGKRHRALKAALHAVYTVLLADVHAAPVPLPGRRSVWKRVQCGFRAAVRIQAPGLVAAAVVAKTVVAAGHAGGLSLSAAGRWAVPGFDPPLARIRQPFRVGDFYAARAQNGHGFKVFGAHQAAEAALAAAAAAAVNDRGDARLVFARSAHCDDLRSL